MSRHLIKFCAIVLAFCFGPATAAAGLRVSVERESANGEISGNIHDKEIAADKVKFSDTTTGQKFHFNEKEFDENFAVIRRLVNIWTRISASEDLPKTFGEQQRDDAFVAGYDAAVAQAASSTDFINAVAPVIATYEATNVCQFGDPIPIP